MHQDVWHYTTTLQSLKPDTNKTNILIRFFRISRILLHTLLGLAIAAAVFPWASQSCKASLIRWWCAKLLATFNFHVIYLGHIPHSHELLSKNMFVANHISWTDIHALNSIIPLRFIAKSEIKNWPVFGYLVSKANTLFINRNKRQDAKRTIEIASQSLLAGDNLCFFPEGTTTDGTALKPFKSSLIQAAIEAQAKIWPIVIRYPNANGGTNTEVAYAGETTLIESMQKILLQKTLTVELHFLEPIAPEQLAEFDRRTLTLHLENTIRHQLTLKGAL